MAWTIDDGTDAHAIRDYLVFAKKYDVRLTFFIYSEMAGWATNAQIMKPMIESGQIQIGNHTASHPDLTKLTPAQVKNELWKCHKFIVKTYGIDPRPYFRPPYGACNSTVIAAAAEIGYTSPMMWSGTLANSTPMSTPQVWKFANRYVGNEIILLGHANNRLTSPLLKPILDLVRKRKLKLVTLNDVFAPPPLPPIDVTAESGDSSAHVTWKSVVNAQSYTVTVFPSEVQYEVKSPQNSFDATGLANETRYRFTVMAHVFGNTSVPSKPSAWVTPQARTPTPTQTP
jgi:peptidoglycan/xylan/chitin deacetylase (PgdA/CDA1 family)